MNKIVLVGRIVKAPELNTTSGGVSYCRFNVACKGKIRDEDGELKTDFFSCVAWRTIADNIHKFCDKGSLLQISGTMGSRFYEKENGTKQTVWEVTVEDVEFLSSKAENGSQEKETKSKKKSSDVDMEPIDDDDLPF